VTLHEQVRYRGTLRYYSITVSTVKSVTQLGTMVKSTMTKTCSAVLRSRRNCSSDGAERTDDGQAFHARAVVTGKAPSPSVVRRVDGMTSADVEERSMYRQRTRSVWLLTLGELCHDVSPHYSTPASSIRHRQLLPLPGGVAGALKTRLRQLCPGLASSILTAAPPVCSQLCGSSGVSPKSLRSCLERPATLHWLRLVDFKVVAPFRVLCGLAPPYLPGRRRLRSSSFISSTACSTIPAHNRRSTHISSRCIAPLQLIAI